MDIEGKVNHVETLNHRWTAVDYKEFVMNSRKKKRVNSNCFRKVTHFVTNCLEDVFFRLGYQFAYRPWWTIFTALVFCGILGSGLLNWREETDDVNLWTTENSQVRKSAKWVAQHFTDDIRYETMIIEADNVLRPDVLKFIQQVDTSIKNISVQGLGWNKLCAKPGAKLKELLHHRKRRDVDEFDLSTDGLFDGVFSDMEVIYGDIANLTEVLPYDFETLDSTQVSIDNDPFDFDLEDIDFTGVFEDKNSENNSSSLLGDRTEELLDLLAMPDKCLTRSILEVWDENVDFSDLSERQILMMVDQKVNESKYADEMESLSVLLSGFNRDKNGYLQGVKTTVMSWFLSNDKENTSILDQWELDFIEHTLNTNLTVPPGVSIHVLTTRSYDDALAETLSSNFGLLTAGFSLIIVYVGLTMGRLNSVEQRFLLAVAGVTVVGQAILSSYGICFFVGLMYGPVHPVLPFLLLGIGVDDMFVIIQALDNLTPEQRRLPIPERIGLAMRHAGVSITVTSLTDVVAFGIGATTGMPALRSFCIYATTGILLLFIFVMTFFVALIAIDESRQDQRRDGCFFYRQPDSWKPSALSQKELLRLFFEKFYGPLLMKTPTKIFVIILTLIFTGVNTWGVLQLKQDFDPNWYLRDGSHPTSFYKSLMEHFPDSGERSAVYFGPIDYMTEREPLSSLLIRLRENPFVKNSSVVFWHENFERWLESKQVAYPSEDVEFKKLVQEFLLFTKDGRQYLHDVKINGSIIDKNFNFTINGSRMRFQHPTLVDASEKNLAIESLLSLENSIEFYGNITPRTPVIYTERYVEWEANKVITEELIRNLGLTLLAVLIVTLVMSQS
ncbi:patched domain-containing protein 3-like isoform X2 [Artemia franciscana]|uniref:patched domain-containing protein 3-like isoform X2 n=1 Tax=Artemia franciscana TaxID=6661 RepID=UPI0032DBA52E